MTPYPYDTDTRENPSIVVSDDGLSWSVPDGLENPLVSPPACDHNSDPDIVYNPRSDELFVYYTVAIAGRPLPGRERQRECVWSRRRTASTGARRRLS